MKVLAAIFVTALALPVALQAETANCGAGHLMDAASVTEKASKEGKSYTIRLEVNDKIYTVESPAASGTLDPKRLTNRETLTICVVGQKLTIRRNDGTELKTTIVREVVESNY